MWIPKHDGEFLYVYGSFIYKAYSSTMVACHLTPQTAMSGVQPNIPSLNFTLRYFTCKEKWQIPQQLFSVPLWVLSRKRVVKSKLILQDATHQAESKNRSEIKITELLRSRPHYAGGIWTWRFHSEIASNVLRHTTPEEIKHQSLAILDLCLNKTLAGKYLLIVTSSFL